MTSSAPPTGPTPAPGNAGDGPDAAYVNALGQPFLTGDRNSTSHVLSYDVLGRLTSDAVFATAVGNPQNVDLSVRRLETAYDTQGNAFKFASYDSYSGSTIVNQVQRGYNGLGQSTVEYQAHGGAVNTSTTPDVI